MSIGLPRRGVVLLVVLGLLSVLALLGVTFVMFADIEAQASRNFRQAAQGQAVYGSLPPEAVYTYALTFLCRDDANDPVLRGESLLADMYGNDDIPFNGSADEDYDFPDTRPIGGSWMKYGGNPLITGTPPAGSPVVLDMGGVLHMWFVDNWNIWHATSPDGLAWTRDPAPVFADARQLALGTVLDDGSGTLRMWYSWGGATGRMGYATSSDGGMSWADHGQVLGPGPDAYDAYAATKPFVMGNPGSGYRMWYTAGASTSVGRTIAYATSSDGVNWTKHGVVFAPQAGTWCSWTVAAPFVEEATGGYTLWFVGTSGTTGRIGRVDSIDGVHWQSSTLRLELDVGSAGTWDSQGVGSPWILPLSNGLRLLYYDATDGSSANTNAIGVALNAERNANRYLAGWNVGGDGTLDVQVASFEDFDAFGDTEQSFADRVAARTGDDWFKTVDNDGDGVKDGVWVDLGFPARTMPNGRRIKPLYSFMIHDLNGRVDLNACGNLVAPAGSGARFRVTAANEGASPGEISPFRVFGDRDGEGRTMFLFTGLRIKMGEDGSGVPFWRGVQGKYSCGSQPPNYDWLADDLTDGMIGLPAPPSTGTDAWWSQYVPGSSGNADEPPCSSAGGLSDRIDEDGDALLGTPAPTFLGGLAPDPARLADEAAGTDCPTEFNVYAPFYEDGGSPALAALYWDTPFTYADLEPLLGPVPAVDATGDLVHRPDVNLRLWWLLGNAIAGRGSREVVLRRQALGVSSFATPRYGGPPYSATPETAAGIRADLNDLVTDGGGQGLWELMGQVLPTGIYGHADDERLYALAQLWGNIRDFVDADYDITDARAVIGGSTWADAAAVAASPSPILGLETPTLVVDEVLVGKTNANHDGAEYVFIELFNPTDRPIDLAGWQVVRDETVDGSYNQTQGVRIIARTDSGGNDGTRSILPGAYVVVTNQTDAFFGSPESTNLGLPAAKPGHWVTADDNPALANLVWGTDTGAAVAQADMIGVQFWLRRPLTLVESDPADPVELAAAWAQYDADGGSALGQVVVTDGFRSVTPSEDTDMTHWSSVERINRLAYDAVIANAASSGPTALHRIDTGSHPTATAGPYYHNPSGQRYRFTNVGELISYLPRIDYTTQIDGNTNRLGAGPWWIELSNALADTSQPPGYLVDWRDEAFMRSGTAADQGQLWRLFGVVGIHSRMAGHRPTYSAADPFRRDRLVGQINVNTANELALRALLNDDAGDPIATALIGSRNGGDTDPFDGNERPFRSLLAVSLNDTLLRDADPDVNATYADNPTLFDRGTIPEAAQHVYHRWHLLRRVMNNTTTVSHQFACWITVGFFEVDGDGNPTQEIGLPSRNLRYRGLFILDRSRARIRAGSNLWAPDGIAEPVKVLYRRLVEQKRGGWD